MPAATHLQGDVGTQHNTLIFSPHLHIIKGYTIIYSKLRRLFISTASSIQLKKLWTVGPLTVFASIIGVLIVRAIARAVLTPPFAPGLEMIMIPIILTLILCTAAVIVFALVGRFAKNPVRTYIIISSVFLVVSFIPDILAVAMPLPGAGWPYSITLMIMHVVAGFITVYMLIKLTATENK